MGRHRVVGAALRRWLAAAGHLVWPASCLVCGGSPRLGGDGLCRTCWDELLRCTGGSYCRRCGFDAGPFGIVDGRCDRCHERRPAFDGIARVGVYGATLRALITAMKFRDQPELARRLAPWMAAAVESAAFVDRIDIFVPVPLHWRRRLSRGFNQSLLLARHLSRHLAKARRTRAIPIRTDLARIRHTPAQWTLAPTDRHENVAGAFAVRPDHDFSRKTVCLVDDITTSGATLNECARVLKRAGAAAVYAVVAAVAMQDVD